MGLRIWETDPEAEPKPRQSFAGDLVGRFRSGYQVNGRPASLEKWRVTTGDPAVADEIRRLMGGERPQSWETSGEDNLEVFTDSPKVKIRLDGPKAIRQEMILWGRNGAIRKCDGVEQTMDEDKGKPCECPASYQDRKDAAKSGRGCAPSITVYFTLADAPELGRFRFNSGSWSLVRDIITTESALEKIDGPAYAWLGLEVVTYEPKGGGAKRSFTKPIIDVIGAAPVAKDADDEPPY
ncbi:recombination directionality factor [Micromonospora sediminicola]|uniref:recombination directionality factor n=1 Tax=Micromonospora sediminicola TaxID=946078 RepID=UPI0037BD63D9